MAIKFFRDGRPSSNFVAMYSIDGQPCSDRNFFQHDMNTHIQPPSSFGLKLASAKFWQASYCSQMVGLSDIATDADGAQGKFPFNLKFHSPVVSDCDCNNYAQCLQNLVQNLPVGTTVFEVLAQADPSASDEPIGTIVITDTLTTSNFGDEQLFFKHQHMEDDFLLKPDWLAGIDRKSQCGMNCTGVKPPKISDGCHSPFGSTEFEAHVNQAQAPMRQDDMVVV